MTSPSTTELLDTLLSILLVWGIVLTPFVAIGLLVWLIAKIYDLL